VFEKNYETMFGVSQLRIKNMNKNFNSHFVKVNEKIIAYSNKKISLDIEEGKMGFCLYFFKLSRLLREPQYQKLAEKLLNDIYIELSVESTKRTAYEIAQIGMGINYLIKQKYVEGNINSILGNIDKLIFKIVVFEKKPITYRINGIIPILYFVCMRIEEQRQGSDERFMLEELGIKLFNSLYQSLDPGFYDEPILFNILNYKLPQFLYVVSKMYSLQFYNYRITEVIGEISDLILSRMPVLHSNRLYLLWALVHLKEAAGCDTWDEQIELLVNRIDYHKIIYKELRNKDVFILDGVAGIFLLLNVLKNTSYPVVFDKTFFRRRIEESRIWKDKEFAQSLALVNGFSGLLWVYLDLIEL